MFVSLLLSACYSNRVPPKPNVQITLVPAANPGGPVQLDFIEGRASGVKPGQQIVLYARSDIWWIQPFANQPFTKIQPDSTWRNATHLGTDYAAILVEPGFHPATKVTTLPAQGNGVVAIATSKVHRLFLRSSTLVDMTGACVTPRATEEGNLTPTIPRMCGPIRTAICIFAWKSMMAYGHVRR
jgi:hypothetical protein